MYTAILSYFRRISDCRKVKVLSSPHYGPSTETVPLGNALKQSSWESSSHLAGHENVTRHKKPKRSWQYQQQLAHRLQFSATQFRTFMTVSTTARQHTTVLSYTIPNVHDSINNSSPTHTVLSYTIPKVHDSIHNSSPTDHSFQLHKSNPHSYIL